MPLLNGVNVAKTTGEEAAFAALEDTRQAVDTMVAEALALTGPGGTGGPQGVQRLAALIRTKLDEAELWMNALVLRA